MDANELGFASAIEIAASVRAGDLSPVEVVEGLLGRIERLNPRVNAFCAVLDEQARDAARAAEGAVRRGEPLGALHGVPIAIKDQLNVAGVRVAFGSQLLADVVASEDAPVVQRLRRAGAIVIGMTTMPEFGWQGHSWSPLYGMTRNPWDLERTAGGSSSGSAAALAAGLVPLAIGSDGAGSIRMPSSFCGVFGLKPTFGRVAQYPVSLSEFVTHLGPMARTVRDAALLLDVTAGPDPRDPTCLPPPDEEYLAACERGVEGLRLAWSPDLGYATVNPEVARLAAAAARRFADLGCTIEEDNPGFDDPIWSADQHLWAGAANRVWDRLPEWRDRMDPGFVAAVEMMAERTLFDASRARAQRFELAATLGPFFERYDLLLTPTMADVAFGTDRRERPYGPSLGWSPFTYPFNLTGQPAASVPCGWTEAGLPVGLQIVGPRFADGRVLQAAAAFEAAQPWSARRPPTDSWA
jgi:aspartyl-tRNA(Asn)/glutamyl-tRNA(Gln) amidotransferase subunit A